MYNFSVYPKTTLRISKYKHRAVSDVVAVLILIVIAIVGAVAVGLILSNTSHSIGSQAANQGNGNSAQTELLVGGSTTIYPVESLAVQPFEEQYHVNVILAQGGSDAGMQGVISGALDVGAASSIKSVYAAYTDVSNNNIQGVTINPVLIGGSGVVVGTSSNCGAPFGTTSPITCTYASGKIVPGTLFDGTGATPNACLEVTRDALALMYDLGTFYIQTGACGGTGVATSPATTPSSVANVLSSYCITTAATSITDNAKCSSSSAGTAVGPFQTLSRSDPGGTEDSFGSYLTGDQGISYSSGQGYLGTSVSSGIVGNLGLLEATQACSQKPGGTTAVGCVGFFDLGFAEGASSQAQSTCPGVSSQPCNIMIPELSSPADTSTADTLTAASTSANNQYILPGQTTAGLHAFIKSALKAEQFVNYETLQPATSIYPDSSAPANSLARTFYLVTNGTPTPVEQEWINYLSSPAAETYFSSNGYFTQYDFTAA